mmetsp:Transcript_56832/g.103920  ORF Transcript_56832/g.103920 Transcript_56832/m.103920 type:complete len:276 (+) Transcript_56832:103-930(+)
MRVTAVVLACLAFSGQARRLQAQADEDEQLSPSAALSSLLLAATPAAGFHASGAAGLGPRNPGYTELCNHPRLHEFFEANPQGAAIIPVIPKADVQMRPQVNFVADMQRRTILNLLTLGAVSVPYGWCLFGYISFFFPPAEGGGGAGVTATDALGNVVTFEGWLKENNAETRKLVQGIRGDATYLIVTKDKKIEDYALNAVCTHLGCVVPWNRAQNKFMCPCHGSQYDTTGKVVRGPAPLSLALAHVTDSGNGKVTLTPWTEQDFRTGQDPWWKP